MSRIACTGAESGSIKELDSVTIGGTGGTRTFAAETGQVRAGQKAWRSYISSAVTTPGRCDGQLNIASTSTGCARFSIYVAETDISSYAMFTAFNITLGQGIFFGVDWATGFFLVGGYDGTLFAGQVNVAEATIGRWYDVYMRWSLSGTKTVTARVDNGAEVTATLPGTYTLTQVSRIRFGMNADTLSFAAKGDVYFDDIIIDNVNAAIDHGRYIAKITPNADTATAQWGTVGSGASHAARVTDGADPPSSDATGVNTTGSASQDIYETINLGLSGFPAKVSAIYGSLRHGDTADSPTDSVHIDFLDGSNTIYLQSAVQAGSTTPISRNNVVIYPWTPNGKTLSELDALRIRIQNSTTAIRKVTVWEVWAMAEIAMQIDASESGVLSDSVSSLTASLPLSETPAFSDLITSLTNRFEEIEVVSLTDGVTSLKNSSSFDESGITNEQITSLKNSLLLDDQGSLTDSSAIFVKVQVSVEDGITLQDVVSSLKNSFETNDEIVEELILENMAFVSILLSGKKKVIFGLFD